MSFLSLPKHDLKSSSKRYSLRKSLIILFLIPFSLSKDPIYSEEDQELLDIQWQTVILEAKLETVKKKALKNAAISSKRICKVSR